MSKPALTIRAFWPVYLREHRNPLSRALHFTGTGIAILILGYALWNGRFEFVAAAILAGYAFAWVGHFFIEHNRPATFRHPFLSLACDFRLFFVMLTGRMAEELKKHEI